MIVIMIETNLIIFTFFFFGESPPTAFGVTSETRSFTISGFNVSLLRESPGKQVGLSCVEQELIILFIKY